MEPYYDNRADADSARKVEALGRPESYPEYFRKAGQAGQVEIIETHMSWVFLTETLVYKLKKPVRTPLLDYTTLDARRSACEAELHLNRKLAKSVYLDVAPLVATDGGFHVGELGTPVDWLVKMRRLPHALLLDHSITHDAVYPEAIDQVADLLAQFYETTAPAPFAPAEYRRRIVSDIEAKQASLENPCYDMRPSDIDRAVRVLERWLDNHADLLEARACAVVDAHGDLRPEHVCLEREPVIIDRLEFDRSLRLFDPISELSFLALECRRLGANWIGRRLIADYTRRRPVEGVDLLVSFYEGYHAIVRAAIALWHLDDASLDHQSRWHRRARWYLQDVPFLV